MVEENVVGLRFQSLFCESRESGLDLVVVVVVHCHVEVEQEGRFGRLGTFRHFRFPVRVCHGRAFLVAVGFGG